MTSKNNTEFNENIIDFVPNYTLEYENHTRCPNCNRKTTGIDDFKNIRSNNIVKTCLKCRKSVYNSLRKRPDRISARTNLKEKIKIYEERINKLEDVIRIMSNMEFERINPKEITIDDFIELLLY